MGEQVITQEMVETVLTRPRRWFEGDTANEYESIVRGRRLHVVGLRRPSTVYRHCSAPSYWVAR